jgi:hypothetical protein
MDLPEGFMEAPGGDGDNRRFPIRSVADSKQAADLISVHFRNMNIKKYGGVPLSGQEFKAHPGLFRGYCPAPEAGYLEACDIQIHRIIIDDHNRIFNPSG